MFYSDLPKGSNFSFDVVYAINDFQVPFDTNISYSLKGQSCAFHNATYAASVNYTNGFQTTNISIIERGALLRSAQDFKQAVNISSLNTTDPHLLSLFATMSLANAMSQYMYGNIALAGIVALAGIIDSGDVLSCPTLAPAYTSVLNSIFFANFATDDDPIATGTFSLSLGSSTYTDLGQLLQDACTNLTASLMSDMANLGHNTTVDVAVLPNYNVYKYMPSRLWIVYGIALLITLLVDIYGIVCILENGGAMQRNFSTIAASVRSRDLDALLNDPGEPLTARAKRAKLRYRLGDPEKGERTGFVVEEEPKGEEDAETAVELTTLTGDSEEAHT
ncbi:unnamed protein product [Peniophora sp. CBMAI 1063]|nr:unnamed protein product [Peniophora sp. CBMAI 1063]